MANTTSKSERGKLDEAVDAVLPMEEEIRRLREDVARLSRDLSAIGSSTVNRAQRAAREGAEHLKDVASEGAEHVRDSAEEMHDNLVECVRERPLTSLALAAAAGYVLALMRR